MKIVKLCIAKPRKEQNRVRERLRTCAQLTRLSFEYFGDNCEVLFYQFFLIRRILMLQPR